MTGPDEIPWRRLDRPMIWVDVGHTFVSLLPTLVAITVFGREPRVSELWPFLLVALGGLIGAVDDVLRYVRPAIA